MKVLKKRSGQPTKYKEEYCERLIDYFDKDVLNEEGELNPPPTLYGFAASINVCHDTLLEWAKVHKPFSVAIKKAKALQADFIIHACFTNKSQAAFSIFMMKNNHGWTDKQEIETTVRNKSLEDFIRETKQLKEQQNGAISTTATAIREEKDES